MHALPTVQALTPLGVQKIKEAKIILCILDMHTSGELTPSESLQQPIVTLSVYPSVRYEPSFAPLATMMDNRESDSNAGVGSMRTPFLLCIDEMNHQLIGGKATASPENFKASHSA